MNVVSILLLLSFLVYLYLGITTYQLNKQSRINVQMLIVCLNFALWSLAYAFMHNSNDLETAFSWYKLSTIGWLFFIPYIVHLMTLLSGNERIINKFYFLIVYGTPSVAFVMVNGFLIDPSLMRRVSYGWTTVYDIGIIWITLYLTAYYGILGVAWYELYRWGKKSQLKREKKQARLFLITSIISLTGASLFDNILPFAGIVRYPLIAPIIILVWMFGLWFSINKYGLMKIDTSFAASEIIDSMNDLLFLTDRDGIIKQTNQHSCRILGMAREEIIGRTVTSLVREEEAMGGALRLFREFRIDHSSIEVNFLPLNGSPIPVRLSASVLRDHEGDLMGVVYVGYDLRENRELRKMKDMMQVELDMAAQVQARLFHSTPPIDTNWDIEIVFRPFSPVSGDFYDFYDSGGSLHGLSLFDVSGHGVAAGLITMIARSIVFKHFTSMKDRPLDEVLSIINTELVKEIGQLDDYMTGILIRFTNGTAEYVNAGHTQLIKRRADGRVEIMNNEQRDIRGAYMGLDTIVPKFTVLKFDIHPGDQILAYSDGLVECFNGSKRRYGLDRLIASFKKAPNGSPRDIMARLISDMEEFTGGRPMRDDLTVILLKRK